MRRRELLKYGSLALLGAACTPAFAKTPGPSPSPGPTPSQTPMPNPDLPVPFQRIACAVPHVGTAISTHAARGYARLGGQKMNATGYHPHAGLSSLTLGQYYEYRYGPFHTDWWESYVEPQLGAEQAVWWQPAITDDEWRNMGNGDPVLVRGRLDAFYAELRERTSAPIVASRPQFMQSNPMCKSLQVPFSQAIEVGLLAMEREGLLAYGPVFPDTPSNQKINRCHPNSAGELVWGEVLLDYFG